ncbi:MAG: aminotransferase class I/II-fold pyridoxal phosphate-dependent enzyme [Acidobacteria bacterium]|nr:aminotransferase class I/II-fold pyridoxal phosphate-dependent enzyme [Acidobacteriota bacterium]
MPFIDLQAQRERIDADLRRRLDAVLEHGQFILGPEVADFESRLGRMCDVAHVQACANGTDALVLALRALGVEPGDRVVVPAYTFSATAEAVALCGAIPVFADVDARTFNVTAETVGEAMARPDADGAPPVGVIVVDLFGQAPDYETIEAVAYASSAWVLADAAQSIGGSFDGRPVGSLARVTTASFFPAKPLGCYGDGGAVLTHDPEIAELLASLHFHGKGEHQYDNVRVGYNSRLDSLQAAVLLAKLEVFEDECDRRQTVAARYSAALEDVACVPWLDPQARSVWAQYTLLLEPEARDAVAATLRGRGVPVGIYYPIPVHRQTAYRKYARDLVLPVAEDLSRRALSLPMHAYLDESIQDAVIAELRRAL